MFMYESPCYLCREVYEYYIQHAVPDVQFIINFFPDYKEGEDNLCETCFGRFREIYELRNPKPVVEESLPSTSSQAAKPLTAEEEEEKAATRKRILDEIKKAM